MLKRSRVRAGLAWLCVVSLAGLAGCASTPPTTRAAEVQVTPLVTPKAPDPSPNEGVEGKELVGKKAPDFDLGQAIPGAAKLSDLRGKTIVLVFHSPICPPSKKAMQFLASLKNKTPAGPFTLIIVDTWDAPEKPLAELKTLKLSVPVVCDPSHGIGEAYRINAIPLIVMIDADGKVTKTIVGWGEDVLGEIVTDWIGEAVEKAK